MIDKCEYKLKNGKIAVAYINANGNLEITKESLDIMVDGWNQGYEQGRTDKYQEIVSEYMLLTEKQVEEIRADAIDEFVELYEKFCNSNIVCGGVECTGKFCARCFRDNFMEQLKEHSK